MSSSDEEFLERVDALIASKDLLIKLRLYFECLGFLKQQANLDAFRDPDTALKLMDFLVDYLQLMLQQAKDEGTTLGMLIFEGFTIPRSAKLKDAFAMRAGTSKAAIERKVFSEFCMAAGFALDPGSLRSELPPKPDLYCSFHGRANFVEMVEITDQRVARRRAQSIKRGAITGGAYSQVNPLVAAFESKAGKSYETEGSPLLVVAYYDKQASPTDMEPSLVRRIVGGIAQAAVVEQAWCAAFVFDAQAGDVLYSFPNGWLPVK